MEKNVTPKGLEEVGDGIFVLRGDLKKGMNIYFLRGPDGKIVQFDAGSRSMLGANRRVAHEFGGIDRIVLGHGHCDHRGTAPKLGPPVYCHPDEVADAESDAYKPPYFDLSLMPFPVRMIYPALLKWWDGGAVKIAGTVEEGDDVAGFEVIHFPGHAPGLIGLWRESDRTAVVSDTVYFVDSAKLKPLPRGEASVPHPAFAWNHQKAKESVRKLAALKPTTVHAGHDEALEGADLTDVLMAAADKY